MPKRTIRAIEKDNHTTFDYPENIGQDTDREFSNVGIHKDIDASRSLDLDVPKHQSL